MCSLLIREMTCFNHQNEFLMVIALLCMITHWTQPKVSNDIGFWVVMTSPSYYGVCVFNLKRILRS